MGWLLDIVHFSQRAKIKCTKCGHEAVDFVAKEGEGLFISCQGCGATTEITMSEIRATLEAPKQQLQ